MRGSVCGISVYVSERARCEAQCVGSVCMCQRGLDQCVGSVCMCQRGLDARLSVWDQCECQAGKVEDAVLLAQGL